MSLAEEMIMTQGKEDKTSKIEKFRIIEEPHLPKYLYRKIQQFDRYMSILIVLGLVSLATIVVSMVMLYYSKIHPAAKPAITTAQDMFKIDEQDMHVLDSESNIIDIGGIAISTEHFEAVACLYGYIVKCSQSKIDFHEALLKGIKNVSWCDAESIMWSNLSKSFAPRENYTGITSNDVIFVPENKDADKEVELTDFVHVISYVLYTQLATLSKRKIDNGFVPHILSKLFEGTIPVWDGNKKLNKPKIDVILRALVNMGFINSTVDLKTNESKYSYVENLPDAKRICLKFRLYNANRVAVVYLEYATDAGIASSAPDTSIRVA